MDFKNRVEASQVGRIVKRLDAGIVKGTDNDQMALAPASAASRLVLGAA